MKLHTVLAVSCGVSSIVEAKKPRKWEFTEYKECEENGFKIGEHHGFNGVNCQGNRCQIQCDAANGFQRIGAGNFKCKRNNQQKGFFVLHPSGNLPFCKTCPSLEAAGLDMKQFNIQTKKLKSGVTKYFIRCKNGRNVLPRNMNQEYAECYCKSKKGDHKNKCFFRGNNGADMGSIFPDMTCKTPVTDVDPVEEDEATKENGGRDPRRIPDDLVSCSESEPDRIVGGIDAIKNSWPWIVQLKYNNFFQCSGTLVDDSTVVTAGHCCHGWHSLKHITGVIGQHDRGVMDEGEFEVSFKSKHKHSEYRQATLLNDICILKTKEPIDFKLHRNVAAQVCLPKANTAAPPAGTKCWAAGWGRIKFRGQIADILQEVDVPLIGDETCANTKNERYFQPTQMRCAGHLEGGKDACTGDSGGPLICAELVNGVQRPVLRGVTSWGLGCASENAPGVYTRVEHYLDWISSF